MKRIRITVVDRAGIIAHASKSEFLPTAPASDYTKPTTRYVSAKGLSENLLPGDHARVRPEHAHLPLVFMLVLTQLAVGTSVLAIAVDAAKWLSLVSVLIGVVALNIATLHLGKPLKAWRAFLGWRKSWFSREVIAFGTFVPIAAGFGAGVLACGTSAFHFGAEGRYCHQRARGRSVLSDDLCRHPARVLEPRAELCKIFWHTALLGLAGALVVSKVTGGIPSEMSRAIVLLLVTISLFKLAFEQRIFRHLVNDRPRINAAQQDRTTAGRRTRVGSARARCVRRPGWNSSAVDLPLNPDSSLAIAAFAFCLFGELLERYLFFTAVVRR